MPHRLQLALTLAAGIAAGVIAVTAFNAPESPPPPVISPLGGTYKGAKLRPVTLTENGKASRLGEPGDGELVHVYLEVGGTPVAVSFAP